MDTRTRTDPPRVELRALDTLWFQVSGTLCNLACHHCLVSASPTNRTHDHLSLATVQRHLAEAVTLGVREFYFTGGEPFLNPEMEAILEAALALGPTTVLTNGLLLNRDRCRRLRALNSQVRYVPRATAIHRVGHSSRSVRASAIRAFCWNW